MLSERSQTQKALHCVIHLYVTSGTGQHAEAESRLMVVEAERKGVGAVTVNVGQGFSPGSSENVPEPDSGDGGTTWGIC